MGKLIAGSGRIIKTEQRLHATQYRTAGKTLCFFAHLQSAGQRTCHKTFCSAAPIIFFQP
ncbi:hypothetical protein EXN66_Car012204 [Channa argus]|uniref:Uncharacterized protein n=1 Tax=Channa argus TaxID=215402 RepID=A0A6G1Q2W1_CHAAH|nr:hypothetical protein EXN66_Car012204 [Channa argus]